MSKCSDAIRYAASRGYVVLENGTVRGPKGERRTRKTKRGHYLVTIRMGLEVVPVYVHKLAAFLVFGEDALAPGVEVRHLNGVPHDNRRENLMLGSRRDNIMDQPTETRRARSKHASSYLRKLTDAQVASLRRERELGVSYAALCTRYGVAMSTVSRLVNLPLSR